MGGIGHYNSAKGRTNMKSRNLIELERKRSGLVGEARDCLNEIKDCSDDKMLRQLEKKHDGLMNDFSLIQLDIDEEKWHIEAEEEARDKRPNQGNGSAPAGDGGYGFETTLSVCQDLARHDYRPAQ